MFDESNGKLRIKNQIIEAIHDHDHDRERMLWEDYRKFRLHGNVKSSEGVPITLLLRNIGNGIVHIANTPDLICKNDIVIGRGHEVALSIFSMEPLYAYGEAESLLDWAIIDGHHNSIITVPRKPKTTDHGPVKRKRLDVELPE